MPAALLLSLVISTSGAPCALKPVDGVATADRQVRIGDVVDLHCIEADKRQRISDLVIAVLPAGQPQLELERAAIKSLVRRRAPGLALQPEPTDREKLILTAPAPTPQRVAAVCYRARQSIGAGKIVVSDDTESTACESASTTAAVTFDRTHRVVRATRDIPAGEFLGRLAAPQTAYDTAEAVTVTVAIGPVLIERKAEVVQPGVAGHDIFVRDSEGSIFAVPTLPDAGGAE